MKREGFIWGSLLVFSLGAGVYGFVDWVARGDAAMAPEPMILRGDEPANESPPSRAPLLPEVPDLSAERSRDDSALGGSSEAGAQSATKNAQLAQEMRLLREAHRALAADPAQALSRLTEHRSRFPNGALREQREALSVMALILMGRRNEAERRYWEFAEDFPESAFSTQLQAMMQEQIPESER